ncbi:hypothetical protein BBK36DRAFT_1175530 [Trichoderma citrinoviride]|uniref:Uncharacterized protein n=1 Tax=Trichoderma citrinoviride TaxID=58853 RepID=A0A2T4BNA2_9HYPO|nr:hypothetical protein BBK36DRAFT_1175530 [Trichoderma citrinoviride]PTB70782.1 hypothetical protein BBK36DRAFT_1175530 [Trichoderma citrinoviride]
MPSSAPPAAAATAAPAPAGLGDNKGIKFQIKTGNARWECTLQDRAQYERMKAKRSDSSDSNSSTGSTSTTESH